MLKEKLRVFFEDPRSKSFWVINDILAGVIIVATALVLLELDPVLSARYGRIFQILEFVVVGIFTLEYFTYIYLAKNKRAYIFSFYGIIDLLAIVPTFLLLANFQFLKIIRVTRLLRLLRLFRLLKILRWIKYRYEKKRVEREMLRVNIQIYLSAFIILTILFSVILFNIERGVPGTQIQTIQDAIWSVISSLSSVGFGDTFPSSFLGKIFLGFVMITGVGFLSFAILIVGKFFQVILFGETLEEKLEETEGPEKELPKKL